MLQSRLFSTVFISMSMPFVNRAVHSASILLLLVSLHYFIFQCFSFYFGFFHNAPNTKYMCCALSGCVWADAKCITEKKIFLLSIFSAKIYGQKHTEKKRNECNKTKKISNPNGVCGKGIRQWHGFSVLISMLCDAHLPILYITDIFLEFFAHFFLVTVTVNAQWKHGFYWNQFYRQIISNRSFHFKIFKNKFLRSYLYSWIIY